jgi:hypothetical protein
MIDTALDLPALAPNAPTPPGPPSGEAFAKALTLAQQSRDRATVRESASKLVSSAFIMPVLEMLHDSEFLEPPFAPTVAEKRFQPLLDQHIADRITSAANFPLVDAIVDRLLGPEPAPAATGDSTGVTR